MPDSVITTGMCMLSCFVPGLMRMSMPGLSSLLVISMFAVDWHTGKLSVRTNIIRALRHPIHIGNLHQQVLLYIIHGLRSPFLIRMFLIIPALFVLTRYSS